MLEVFKISARTHSQGSIDAAYEGKLEALKEQIRNRGIRIVGFEGRAQQSVLVKMDPNDLPTFERSLNSTWQVKKCPRFPIPG